MLPRGLRKAKGHVIEKCDLVWHVQITLSVVLALIAEVMHAGVPRPSDG